MAGAAPTDFQFTRTLNAGPVHGGVWLSTTLWPRRVVPMHAEEKLKVRCAGRHAHVAGFAPQYQASPAFLFRLIVNDDTSTLHVGRNASLLTL